MYIWLSKFYIDKQLRKVDSEVYMYSFSMWSRLSLEEKEIVTILALKLLHNVQLNYVENLL